MVFFVLGSIYQLMVICGSFMFGGLFDFISAHVWFNRALYFPLKKVVLWSKFSKSNQLKVLVVLIYKKKSIKTRRYFFEFLLLDSMLSFFFILIKTEWNAEVKMRCLDARKLSSEKLGERKWHIKYDSATA